MRPVKFDPELEEAYQKLFRPFKVPDKQLPPIEHSILYTLLHVLGPIIEHEVMPLSLEDNIGWQTFPKNSPLTVTPVCLLNRGKWNLLFEPPLYKVGISIFSKM